MQSQHYSCYRRLTRTSATTEHVDAHLSADLSADPEYRDADASLHVLGHSLLHTIHGLAALRQLHRDEEHTT